MLESLNPLLESYSPKTIEKAALSSYNKLRKQGLSGEDAYNKIVMRFLNKGQRHFKHKNFNTAQHIINDRNFQNKKIGLNMFTQNFGGGPFDKMKRTPSNWEIFKKIHL